MRSGILSRTWTVLTRTLTTSRTRHRLWRHRGAILILSFFGLVYLYIGEDAFQRVDTTHRPIKVLIVSYKSAGSAYIADVLQKYPGSFYHAEPLKNLEMDSTEGQTIRFLNGTNRHLIPLDLDSSLTTELSQHFINCRHELLDIGSLSVYYHALDTPIMRDTRDYFMCHGRHWYSDSLIDFPNTRLAFINSIIKEESQSRILHCLPLLSDKCKAASVRIFEFTQLRMSVVKQILEQTEDVKVIYLIRDPRAILEPSAQADDRDTESSQLFVLRTKDMCSKILEDLQEGDAMKVQFPDKVLALRYEDYLEDAVAVAKKVYTFIGEPAEATSELVNNVEDLEIETPPGDTIWRESLEQTDLTLINDLCEKIYSITGYINYNDVNDIRNLNQPTYISGKEDGAT